MASALPNPSEIKYLQDDVDGTPDAVAGDALPRARDDALRRQRRNSAKDFFSTPASVRLSVTGTSNRVAPEPRPTKGRMTQTEINRYVKKFSHMKPEEIRSLETLFHSWDLDNSGEISMEEMMMMMERVVRDLFEKTDTDNSGMLDAEEVRQLALDLGQHLTNEELQEAMEQMDRDGVGAVGPNGVEGKVGFDEFAAWWLGKGGKDSTMEAQAEELADLFSEVDSDGSGAIDVDEFIGMIAGKMESIIMRSTDMSGGQAPIREGIAMVRLAMQSVKDDVRAIYGMDERPKSTIRAAQELENTTRQRRCFFTTEPLGKPLAVNFRKTWDIVQVFVLAYIAIAVPYRAGFGIEVPAGSATFWFEVACDIYFVFDIALNFRTAYRDEDSVLITDSKEIARMYMRSWLLIDVCACFPVTYIELLVGADGGVGAKLKALKIFRLLRLAKMLRLAKLKKVLKRIDEKYVGVWTLSKLSSLIAIILYMAHIFACGWYAVGSGSQTLVNGVVIHGWVRRLGYDSSFDYTDDATAHEAYTHMFNWPADDLATPYIDAYYYAITTLTTVGYGDRCPVTDVEKVFSILTEVAGGITFGILAGTLSAMVTESNASEQQAADHLDSLKNFMSAKRVHHTLRHQIMEQMEYFFRTKTVFDESDIMEKLPPKFRKSLLLTMYKPQLRTCPLFAGLEETIITKLALSLRPYLGLEGDCVIEEGELGEDMYLVVRGEVKLTSHEWPKFNGKLLGDGAFLGELPILDMGGGPLRNRHVYDVHCAVVTDMTFLTKDHIMALDGDFPEFKLQVQKLAAKRAQRFGINLAWSGKGSWSDEKLEDDDLAMMKRLESRHEPGAQVAEIVSSNSGSPESTLRSSSRDVHAKVDGLEVSVIQAEQKLEARVASLEKGLNARFDELVAHLRSHGIATGVDEDSEGSAIPGAVNV